MTQTAVTGGALRALRHRAARLAELVATPLVPSDYLDLVDPLRNARALRGRVVSVDAETADAATLVVQPGRGWRPHLPGQYVRVGVDVDGVRQWRAYSITSVPDRADGRISITVTAQPGGTVSTHLVRHARAGLVVQLEQAAGDFVLPRRPGKVLLVTAGSGLTPVMGMLRASVDELDDVVVVHSDRTPEDVLFATELGALADAGRLRLVQRHTATAGRLDARALAAEVPDLAQREAWACGPAGLLDELERHYDDLGLADRLHTERFAPVVLASGGAGGTVAFTTTGTVVEADGTTPLLQVGEDSGVLMPSGCRMGICFGCVLPLRQGAVRDLRTGDLTTATPGDGVLVQTCISAAAGDCQLDV